MMNKLRWELAKALNRLMWFICPEPQKTMMKKDWAKTDGAVKEDE